MISQDRQMYTIITSWNIKSASTPATIEAFWEQGVDEKGKKGLELELGKGKGEAASIGYIDRLIDTLKR